MATTGTSINSLYAELLDVDNIVSLCTTSKPCILPEYDKDIKTGHPNEKKSSEVDVVESVDKSAVEVERVEILELLLARDCHKDAAAVLVELEAPGKLLVKSGTGTVLDERLGVDNGGTLVLELVLALLAFFIVSNALLTLNLSLTKLSLPEREPVDGACADLTGGMMGGSVALVGARRTLWMIDKMRCLK